MGCATVSSLWPVSLGLPFVCSLSLVPFFSCWLAGLSCLWLVWGCSLWVPFLVLWVFLLLCWLCLGLGLGLGWSWLWLPLRLGLRFVLFCGFLCLAWLCALCGFVLVGLCPSVPCGFLVVALLLVVSFSGFGLALPLLGFAWLWSWSWVGWFAVGFLCGFAWSWLGWVALWAFFVFFVPVCLCLGLAPEALLWPSGVVRRLFFWLGFSFRFSCLGVLLALSRWFVPCLGCLFFFWLVRSLFFLSLLLLCPSGSFVVVP